MTGTHVAEDCADVVRIATFVARAGQLDRLLEAARANARDAHAADGCRSAEVCVAPDDPETVLVISRWRSRSDLQAFLDWHESRLTAPCRRMPHGHLGPATTGWLQEQSSAEEDGNPGGLVC